MACKTACGKNSSQAHVAGIHGSGVRLCNACIPRSKKLFKKVPAGNTDRKVTSPKNSRLVNYPEHPTSISKNSLFVGEINGRIVEALAEPDIPALLVKEMERKP